MTTSTTDRRIDAEWIASLPELDDLQAATLQGILNRAAQLPGDWSGMMGPTGGRQEDFGAIRYQLAFMSDALAFTHAFRLPAAPAVFKRPFELLIDKMLHSDTWFFWRDISRGGHPLNLSLGEMKSEWDPMVRDNIMYSAYVQTMSLMYHHLFNDDKYSQAGALTVGYSSPAWSANESFKYDERSLNDHLYWLMVEKGYLGIACEPNCVFLICNQPPIIGFRLHDMLYGGDLAGEVSAGWLKAWEEFGGIYQEGGEGSFKALVMEKERVNVPAMTPTMDFWLANLMNSWNPKLIQEQYPILLEKWAKEGPDGTLWVPWVDPFAGIDMDVPASMTAPAQDMGWAAACASEVGDTETVNRLLAYADRFMHPAWENGGLYHKRCDDMYDADGNFCNMDPMTGNALFPLARLNVPNGRKRIYEGEWADGQHFDKPAIVDMSPGLDVRRAWFDDDRNALALTFGPARNGTSSTRLVIGNVADRDIPTLWRDGIDASESVGREGEQIVIEFEHESRTDMVISW